MTQFLEESEETIDDNLHFAIVFNEGSQWVTWKPPVLTMAGMIALEASLGLILDGQPSESVTFDLRNVKSAEDKALGGLRSVAAECIMCGAELKFVTPPPIIHTFLGLKPFPYQIVQITN